MIGESISFKAVSVLASGFGKNKNVSFRDLHLPARLPLGGKLTGKLQ